MSASAIITDFHRISTTPPDFRSKCKWICLRDTSTVVVYSKLYDQLILSTFWSSIPVQRCPKSTGSKNPWQTKISSNWELSTLQNKICHTKTAHCLLPFLSNQIETIVRVHGSAHHPRVSLHHPTHILKKSSWMTWVDDYDVWLQGTMSVSEKDALLWQCQS